MKSILTILFFILATTCWGQNLSTKKNKALNKLANARTEKNDSIKASYYRQVGEARNYFSYDSSRIFIDEGLAFNKERNIMDIHHFLLLLYSTKLEYSKITIEESILKLKALLPKSKGLNPRGELYVLKDIGANFKLLTTYDSALFYYDKANQVALKSKDSFNSAKLTGHIADLYTRLDNYQKAKKILEDLISSYPKAKRIGSILSTTSLCYNNDEEYSKTISLFKERIDSSSKLEILSDASGFAANYCAALIGLKRYEQAMIEINEQIAFLKQNKKPILLKNLYQYKSELLKLQGKYSQALIAIDSANYYVLNKATNIFKVSYTKQKTEIYTAVGLTDSAIKYLAIYETLLKEEYEKNVNKQYTKSIALYETKEKEQEIALLQKENELGEAKFWRLIGLVISGIVLLLVLGLLYRSRLIRKNVENKQALVEAQLTSIRSQLNPHFMFNALNSIKNYIVKNDSKAASHYLAKFTKLMRGILDLSSKSSVELHKELEILNLYVELEQMRFKDVFDYELEIDKNIDLHKMRVPPLFLQPFLENAIKHGLTPLEDERHGILNLSIKKSAEQMIFEVTDNGVGRNKTVINDSRESKGIKLSQERITLLNSQFKDDEDFVFFDLKDSNGKPSGTKVQITLKV